MHFILHCALWACAVGALLPSKALAQSWRPDMESGQDVWGLAMAVSAAFAFVTIRDAFRTSRARGWLYVVIWSVAVAAATAWPPARQIFYAVLLLFMAVVIVQMFRA